MKRSEFGAEASGHLLVSVVLPVYNEARVLETLTATGWRVDAEDAEDVWWSARIARR